MLSREVRERIRYRGVPGWAWFRVNTEGVVESCRQHGPGNYLTVEWVALEGRVNDDGYVEVRLSADGVQITARVHTLVLLAFVGPKPDGMQVRHLDGNRQNNRLSNLTWGTPQENIDDRERHGTTARGERNGRATASDAEIIEMRQLRAEGWTHQRLAIRFNLSKRQVGRIVNHLSRTIIEAPRDVQIHRSELLLGASPPVTRNSDAV